MLDLILGGVLEASWSDLGRVLGGQDAPKMSQDGAKTAQDGAKTVQDGAKMRQVGAKTPPDGAKTLQDGAKTGQVGAKMLQDTAKTPQDGAKTGQEPQDTKTMKNLRKNNAFWESWDVSGELLGTSWGFLVASWRHLEIS